MIERKKTTIDGFAEYSREVATEGLVLLKNEDQFLPIKADEELAVFGRCQIDYFRSGTGSGGSVHVPYSVNALEGFRNNGHIKINEHLAKVYESYVEENPFDNGGGGWAAEPWFQKEMPLSDQVAKDAANRSQKALIIIGRTAGEEQDNKDREGSFRLTTTEREMLTTVTAHFDQVGIILNVSNIIDMSWLDNKQRIKSVVYAWHGGMEGGNALVDVISGDVTPSGKLTDTIAYDLELYPSHKNFDKELELFYQEDIYLGYRYFETFNREGVRFPFGYGLSYSSFDTKVESMTVKGHDCEASIELQVRVANSGDEHKGKEVVQVYVKAPQGALGKPARELVGFCKTNLLEAGESQELTLSIPVSTLASYDDSGITGHKSCYVLEPGEYHFYVGSDVRSAKELSEVYDVSSLMVLEVLEEVLAPVKSFDRFKPGQMKEDGNYELVFESVPQRSVDLEKVIEDRLPRLIAMTGDKGIKLEDVKSATSTMEAFIAQLPQNALETIVRGEGMSSPKVTAGTAGAFGGVGDNLLHFGIPVACASDGPSGIRMDTGELATQVPIGTLQACTWNIDMINKLYVYEGRELTLNQVDTLLGPGMNIHRHPLNGRNFEYFSEDPYLTGCMAIATVKGLREGGAQGTIKHFAANDQEHNRRKVDSIASERALREIHLKGFEMAVKEGKAKSIMTTYNPINGIWNASNYDLNTTVLRKEWNYSGIVMTDWWAVMNDPVHGGPGSVQNMASMVRAQNDIFMPVNNFGAEVNSYGDDIKQAVLEGVLTIGELQRCAMNICRFILDSPSMNRPLWQPSVTHFKALETIESDDILGTDTDIELHISEDNQIVVEVEKAGKYCLVVLMMHDHGPSAQSSCNVIINGETGSVLNLNGTNGRYVKEKNMPVELEKGFYNLGFVFVKPGIEISSINLMSV